jgi:hypothetical protein
MGERPGRLHEESYAHVDEVKGESIAFSSEVDARTRSRDAGSREENASNKKAS